MTLAVSITLLLAISPGIAAEPAEANRGTPAVVDRAPSPAIVGETPPLPVRPVVSEARLKNDRTAEEGVAQQQSNRAFWFVLGALAAVAVILAVTL